MDYSFESLLNAFLLTLLAGLATSVGAAIAFMTKRTNYRVLAFSLSFSAGIMLYVSFVEIYQKGTQGIASVYGEKTAMLISLSCFFAGLGLIAIIDSLLPSTSNPHEARTKEEYHMLSEAKSVSPSSLHRMGIFTALAIGLHNFPEGMATFFASLDDSKVGIAIAIAIALHNIPEGMSVAVPIYFATGKRSKAFWYATLSGIAEPLGALIGYIVLRSFLTEAVMGGVFSAIAGIMVFISLDELLPTARVYAKGHDVVHGIVAGMAVMGLSLYLLA
jgi:ZIP family zinc transporter